MRGVLDQFDELGAGLLGVVCQRRSNVERFFARDPLPFPLVVDEDRSLAHRWGVYHRLGVDALHIAHPATFVVDGAGIVRLAFVAPNQVARFPLDQILDCLRGGTMGAWSGPSSA